MEDTFSTNWGWGYGFQDDSSMLTLYCAIYFYYYSDHQALGHGGWGTLLLEYAREFQIETFSLHGTLGFKNKRKKEKSHIY